jgi:hypothetical protein
MFQLREGLSNKAQAAFVRSETGEPRRGGSERHDRRATCGFALAARVLWFAWFDPERRTAAAR